MKDMIPCAGLIKFWDFTAMNNEQVQVYAAPLPFSNAQQAVKALPGSTLQEIVNNVIPAPYKRAGIAALVMINGESIPMEYWPSIKPKQGAIVNIRVVPQGGGGGKNPIATLLSIAVLVAAPYIGQFAAFSLAGGMGPLTAAQTAFGQFVTAAVGAIGRLAVSALAPPPSPSNRGFDKVSNPAESPTQFIEGAKNSITPFGVVPVCLGTNRMFPLQAARPFTETKDNDQYVRQLFTYGFGPQVVISDLKIGESALTDFDNFDIEHKLAGDLHTGTDLYASDVFQEDMSVLVEKSAGFITRTTQIDTDEAVVDVTFPQGLCQYNDQGKRNSYRVQLELQYAETGVSPQDWTPATSGFKTFAANTITVPIIPLAHTKDIARRTDYLVVDKYFGGFSLVAGDGNNNPPTSVGENNLRIAKVEVVTERGVGTDITVTDIRDTSLFGVTFENSSSFVPTKASATSVDVTSGGILVNDLNINGNQKEALRKSVRVVFPTRGQYDLRIRRITDDSDSDQIFDDAYLSALKSFKHENPVVPEGMNGTAMRIRATDQLNGALEQFNVLCSNVIPDYDVGTGTWLNQETSNPASIYRYVLQGLPNGKALPDSKVNIADLEDWHVHCETEGYTYNRVIDYETSVDEILRDVCAAGAASPAIVDGKRTIVIDRVKDDIVQIVTPRNSWGYSGEMIYPELPHAFRVQFRNKDKGYAQDEIIVYDDGYDVDTATKFEVLELQSCTDSDLAFKTGRRHIAAIRLRPETHSFVMDVEHLVALRGNRIKFEHDVPIIGIGDGRIKTVTTDGGSPEMVTGITIDDTVTIPALGTYYVRIRLADGSQLYKELTISSIGDQTSFTFTTPFDIADTPAAGDLCYFVEAGGELDLIITRIEPQDDLTARITAIDYAQPAINNSENSAIPAWDSKITTPLEFIRPLPPVLLDEQSDEQAMLLNSDGTYTPRAIFTLENPNEGEILISVQVRVSGTDVFTTPNVLEATPNRVILTGLDDGTNYDIHFRYRRLNGSMYSTALELNNYTFVGASGTPSDPTNFTVNIDSGTAYFKWDKAIDIDFDYSQLRYFGAFTGATWGTSLILEEKIYDNRVEVPFVGGTYLLKHFDQSGNESDNATVIVTYDPGIIENAIATIDEFNDSPALAGVLDNTSVADGNIKLADTDLLTGYYYFNESVDLTGVFTAFVSANITAGGAYVNNLFDEPDLFALDDLFGVGGADLFGESDLFSLSDMFGIGPDAWEVSMEYRTTQEDPASSPVTWSDWATLEAGTYEFWAIEFRLKLTSLEQNISPNVTAMTVRVDMPDRIERGDDLNCDATTGATVTFTPEFKETPAVAITLQDGAVDDRIEFSSKTSGGFAFKVYNDTAAAYVTRSFDYIASGYGRKNT
jgi:hypothetical protein